MTVAWSTLRLSGRLFESARWLADQRCFQWVDILSSRLYHWCPATDEVATVEFGFEFLPLATPSPIPGVQILADRDTLYYYLWGEEPDPFATVPVGPGCRLNDGVVDENGDVWIGSMSLAPDPKYPLGSLWRIDSDGHLDEMLSRLGISNGIVWQDSTHGFFVDSLSGRVDAITLDGRTLRRETILEVSAPGEPDGITFVDGLVWVAVWNSAELRWIDPTTGRSGKVAVPASRPSSVAMSDDLILVTTGGRGEGVELDTTGSVLVCERGRFDASSSTMAAGG